MTDYSNLSDDELLKLYNSATTAQLRGAAPAQAKPWSAETISRAPLPVPDWARDRATAPAVPDWARDEALPVPDWARDAAPNPFDEFDTPKTASPYAHMSDADLMKAYAAAGGAGLDAAATQSMRREQAANGDARAAADYISAGGDTKDVLKRDLGFNARVQGNVILNDAKEIPGKVGDAIMGASRFAGRVAHDVVNPDDALSDAKGVASGAWNAARGAASDPVGTLRAVNKMVDDPSHPLWSFMNAATLATGGEATAGRGALKGITRTAAGADAAAVRPVTSLLSGVSGDAQKLAQGAGEQGGAAGRAFRANMSEPDYAGMQRTGQQGVAGLKNERGSVYQQGMQDVANSKARIRYTNTLNAVDSARRDFGLGANGTFPKNPSVMAALGDADSAIAEHRAIAGTPLQATARSPFEMDELKQRLNQIWRGFPEGSPEAAAVGRVRAALGDDIVSAVPRYADVMAGYGDASDSINDVIKSLGAGKRVSRSTTAGKLMSAMRDGSTKADALADVSRFAPTLPYQIAGATMNPLAPRNLVGRGVAALKTHALEGAGIGAVLHPVAIPAAAAGLLKAIPGLALASPRVIGNLRYGLGATTRGARAAGITQKNIGRAVEAARMSSIWNPDSE